MIRNPSCLISCSHRPPDGSVWALVGRRNEAGRKSTLQHDAVSKVGQRQLQLRRACFFGKMVLVMTGRPPAVVASPGPSENPHGGSGRFNPRLGESPCARQRGRYLLP